MGLIKTAMMSGAAMYGMNKIAKGYESHQGNRPMQQQQQQSQRQSREYSPTSSQRNNAGDYYDNRNVSPPSFNPNQQQRSIDQSSTPYPQEYWYLNNNNEWARLPSEYANMRTSNPAYDLQAPQYPPRQQQRLEFDYPQQQGGYVVEELTEPRSRSMVSSDQIQQGLGFLMNASSKGGKKGKDDKMSDVMSMFSR